MISFGYIWFEFLFLVIYLRVKVDDTPVLDRHQLWPQIAQVGWHLFYDLLSNFFSRNVHNLTMSFLLMYF